MSDIQRGDERRETRDRDQVIRHPRKKASELAAPTGSELSDWRATFPGKAAQDVIAIMAESEGREKRLRAAIMEFARVERMFGHHGQHKDSECADCKRVRMADEALSNGYIVPHKKPKQPMILITDTDRLEYLSKLLTNCPHAEIIFNDDPGADEPVGFTIRVEGCEKSEITALTLRDAIDRDAEQSQNTESSHAGLDDKKH